MRPFPCTEGAGDGTGRGGPISLAPGNSGHSEACLNEMGERGPVLWNNGRLVPFIKCEQSEAEIARVCLAQFDFASVNKWLEIVQEAHVALWEEAAMLSCPCSFLHREAFMCMICKVCPVLFLWVP